jgi:hypothetical protein
MCKPPYPPGTETTWRPQLVQKALTSADATLVALTSAEGTGAHSGRCPGPGNGCAAA